MNQEINKVAKKISDVSRLVGNVPKGGFNAHFKFHYQAWDDVLPAVRNACVEVGLIIVPNIGSVERGPVNAVDKYGNATTSNITTVKTQFQFIDTESGQMLTQDFSGEAQGTDDKAIQKAMTSATKYAFLKMFQIPVAGDVDPDGEAPKQTEAPVSQPTTTQVDWNARGLSVFVNKADWDAWTSTATANKIAWGTLLKKVWETNGDKTTKVELQAALEEAINAKPLNGKALKDMAQEVLA